MEYASDFSSSITFHTDRNCFLDAARMNAFANSNSHIGSSGPVRPGDPGALGSLTACKAGNLGEIARTTKDELQDQLPRRPRSPAGILSQTCLSSLKPNSWLMFSTGTGMETAAPFE